MGSIPVIETVDITLTTEQRDVAVRALSLMLNAAETAVRIARTFEEIEDAKGMFGDTGDIMAVRDLIARIDPRDSIEYRTALAEHLRVEHGWRHHVDGDLPSTATLHAIHERGHRHAPGHPQPADAPTPGPNHHA